MNANCQFDYKKALVNLMVKVDWLRHEWAFSFELRFITKQNVLVLETFQTFPEL